ncbi:MAG: FG-GAP repeat domain-containing protein [Bdellovibrionales bacterium]
MRGLDKALVLFLGILVSVSCVREADKDSKISFDFSALANSSKVTAKNVDLIPSRVIINIRHGENYEKVVSEVLSCPVHFQIVSEKLESIGRLATVGYPSFNCNEALFGKEIAISSLFPVGEKALVQLLVVYEHRTTRLMTLDYDHQESVFTPGQTRVKFSLSQFNSLEQNVSRVKFKGRVTTAALPPRNMTGILETRLKLPSHKGIRPPDMVVDKNSIVGGFTEFNLPKTSALAADLVVKRGAQDVISVFEGLSGTAFAGKANNVSERMVEYNLPAHFSSEDFDGSTYIAIEEAPVDFIFGYWDADNTDFSTSAALDLQDIDNSIELENRYSSDPVGGDPTTFNSGLELSTSSVKSADGISATSSSCASGGVKLDCLILELDNMGSDSQGFSGTIAKSNFVGEAEFFNLSSNPVPDSPYQFTYNYLPSSQQISGTSFYMVDGDSELELRTTAGFGNINCQGLAEAFGQKTTFSRSGAEVPSTQGIFFAGEGFHPGGTNTLAVANVIVPRDVLRSSSDYGILGCSFIETAIGRIYMNHGTFQDLENGSTNGGLATKLALENWPLSTPFTSMNTDVCVEYRVFTADSGGSRASASETGSTVEVSIPGHLALTDFSFHSSPDCGDPGSSNKSFTTSNGETLEKSFYVNWINTNSGAQIIANYTGPASLTSSEINLSQVTDNSASTVTDIHFLQTDNSPISLNECSDFFVYKTDAAGAPVAKTIGTLQFELRDGSTSVTGGYLSLSHRCTGPNTVDGLSGINIAGGFTGANWSTNVSFVPILDPIKFLLPTNGTGASVIVPSSVTIDPSNIVDTLISRPSNTMGFILDDIDNNGIVDLIDFDGSDFIIDFNGSFDGSGAYMGPLTKSKNGVNSLISYPQIFNMYNDAKNEVFFVDGSQRIKYLEYNGSTINAAVAPAGTASDDCNFMYPIDDYEGDGDSDLVCFDVSTDSLKLFANDGSNNFSSPSNLQNSLTGMIDGEYADLDGNGSKDLLFVFANSVFKKLQTSPGTFGSYVNTSLSQTGITKSIAKDLDSDGHSEVVISYDTSGSNLRIYSGGVWSSDILGNSFYNGAPYDFTFADIDGDGKQDLILVAYDPGVFVAYLAIYKQRSLNDWDLRYKRFNLGSFSSPSGGDVDIEAKDMDGDGLVDIVVRKDGISVLNNRSINFD